MQESMERNRARTWVSWLSMTKAMRVRTKRMTAKFPPRRGKESDMSKRGRKGYIRVAGADLGVCLTFTSVCLVRSQSCSGRCSPPADLYFQGQDLPSSNRFIHITMSSAIRYSLQPHLPSPEV